MKRSLHIGINDYPGTKSDLHGCVNDARDWEKELNQRGFSSKIILDSQATKANMVKEITKIIQDTKTGDISVITYSGHGTWVPDKNGDEADGRDEGLCPYDINRGQILLDDELFKIFNKRAARSQIVFISDSCHSGTVSRGFDFSDDPDEVCPVEKRYLDTQLFLGDDITEKLWKQQPIEGVDEEAVVFFSGCSDIEYSYDASFSRKPNGAFTYMALRELRKLPQDATYAEWYSAIRGHLPHPRYPQTPKLSGSTEQTQQKIFEI